MSMLIATIAFVMAFGALWFTSEIARRLDAKGQTRSDQSRMQESLRRAEKQIRELARNLDAAEQQIQSLKSRSTTISGQAELALNERPVAPMNTLDILRGPQRFYPSDTYRA